ncbi:hypothetical protein B1T47_24455 [Mycobacterium kansasii]|nr:hypothetical protein B1T47_24455 [Mycobacterium kansasii]
MTTRNNALAETVNGYYKAELIYGPARTGPWKTVEDVEPAEFEATFYATKRTDQPLVEIQ